MLGVKPVAASDDSLKNPFHAGQLDDIVNIGAEPNAEAILKLDPDLILTFDYIEEAQYEQLVQIAPVVRLKYGGALRRICFWNSARLPAKRRRHSSGLTGGTIELLK